MWSKRKAKRRAYCPDRRERMETAAFINGIADELRPEYKALLVIIETTTDSQKREAAIDEANAVVYTFADECEISINKAKRLLNS